MENSEVLEQNTNNIDQRTSTQASEPSHEPEVLNQVTNNIYTDSPRVTQPMGEADHATDIANNVMSNAEAKQTFNYSSSSKKDYSTDVNTTTTQSNGSTLNGTFKSNYMMNDDYKASDDSDYSWNKLAAEMAQTNYDQEAGQARYESIQAKQEIDQAASSAFNNYFAAEYSARQTQDKMGWTGGGQQTASDLQVEFLQAETAANMFTQEEMQKYGVETKLGVARMYAEAEQKTLALQYYQDALDQAISEANETGYYIPPEASEMMQQQKLADDILNNPFSSEAERARANSVNAACQAYYDALGFERGTRVDDKGNVVTEYYGIKTLSTLTYEETVRNNKINEELQRQANNIAQQNVNATWASVRVAEYQHELTKSIQNQTHATNIDYALETGKASKVTSSSKTNYYIGADGKEHTIESGANMIKYNGDYYYSVSSDTGHSYAKVWNSDEAHATEHANKAKTNNNYRARTS